MLKRQRPISPPPSISSAPSLSEPPAYDIMSKRRRTMPPVLDGPSRGWGYEPEPDDEDEYFDEGNVQEHIPSEWNGGSPNITDIPGDYKLTNTMLHELHALQQHRLLFSPQLALPIPETNTLSSHNTRPSSITHNIPLTSDRRTEQIKDPSCIIVENSNTLKSVSATEQLCVKERYEESNRLLGSLFLSRRRQLGSTENSTLTL